LIDPSDLGLAGARRLLRLDTTREQVRPGQFWKTSRDTSHALSGLWEDEATERQVFDLVRDPWSIENRQHDRRDRTQDEDRCGTHDDASAQNLSLLRPLAIYLFEQQRSGRGTADSLPLYEKRTLRRPRTLIDRFTTRPA
jgi:hypothetical protein